jgi:hypothetical protein
VLFEKLGRSAVGSRAQRNKPSTLQKLTRSEDAALSAFGPKLAPAKKARGAPKLVSAEDAAFKCFSAGVAAKTPR